MASLTAIFGSSSEKDEGEERESEKLLNLYWNRAELKKEFARLRNEQFELKDRIKEHEGSAARLQQKLDHLENLLLDPEWVYNVVTYFQLRGLNLRCQGKLAKFAEQLKQQREQKQHSQLVDQWNEQRMQEAAGIESEIGEQRLHVQLLEDRLQAERHRLATMSGFMKLFRGRSLTASLDNLAQEIDAAQFEENSLLQRYDEVQNRTPPDTQGLDIPTKRLINFMILAFAQQLYLHFQDDDIAMLAKEAGDKSVGAINYGAKEHSDLIIKRVKKRADSMDSAADYADILQERAKLIATKAQFRSDDDAVPISRSVATVFEIKPNGKVRTHDGNLLGENYWNLAGIVSR